MCLHGLAKREMGLEASEGSSGYENSLKLRWVGSISKSLQSISV